LKNYEMKKMKDKWWIHSWRLGVHMRWLDFKDLEQKKEARIEQPSLHKLKHMAMCSIVEIHIAFV
jgi:hypothetical protein